MCNWVQVAAAPLDITRHAMYASRLSSFFIHFALLFRFSSFFHVYMHYGMVECIQQQRIAKVRQCGNFLFSVLLLLLPLLMLNLTLHLLHFAMRCQCRCCICSFSRNFMLYMNAHCMHLYMYVQPIYTFGTILHVC